MCVVLVTGANRGLGLEFVRQYLNQNNDVIACCRKPDEAVELNKLKSEFPHQLEIFSLDMSLESSVDQLALKLRQKECIDILINNAGIYVRDGDFKTLNLNDVKKNFEVNTLGPMRVTKALLPLLLKSQNPKMVVISSKMGSIADNTSGGAYSYRISKAALNCFVGSFCIDFPNIVSLALHPGWVQTDMGGAQGLINATESVSGLIEVITKSNLTQTGGFYAYDGRPIVW